MPSRLPFRPEFILIGLVFVILSFSIFSRFSASDRRHVAETTVQTVADSQLGAQTGARTNATGVVNVPRRKKLIIFWTNFFSSDNFYFGFGNQPFVDNGCLETRCETTKDRSRLNEADAVVFSSRQIRKASSSASLVKGLDFPPHKPSGQRWIFYNQEPPPFAWIGLPPGFTRDSFGPVFNWTMTYRLDSDVPNPHGWTERKSEQDTSAYVARDYAKNKTKMVAWLVSHCHPPSKREKYVARLRKIIPVDVYGGCGKKTCPRNRDVDCMGSLIHDYKFYLGFENNICRDYITDKMWKILSRTTTVPIVMGGANYDVDAPPGSFIDARRYRPEELGEFLKKVAADDSRYNEFHAWRKGWVVREGPHHNINPGFCRLCARLYRDRGIKWYDKITDFWDGNKDCFPELITWG